MLLKINRKVEYALIALQHLQLAGENEYITARFICDKYKIPFDTTAKVLQLMNQNHILASQQGVKGGYKLNKDLDQINYLDIYEIVERKKIKKDCVDSNCSLLASCNISGPISQLNSSLIGFFKNLSLKEILTSSIPKQAFSEGHLNE